MAGKRPQRRERLTPCISACRMARNATSGSTWCRASIWATSRAGRQPRTKPDIHVGRAAASGLDSRPWQCRGGVRRRCLSVAAIRCGSTRRSPSVVGRPRGRRARGRLGASALGTGLAAATELRRCAHREGRQAPRRFQSATTPSR